LTLLDRVRVIPGRREVCRGEWNGQGVFAKIFLGKDALKYAKRDADGIAILQQEHIATPKLLHAGTGTMQSGELVQVIVLEEIKNSKNIEDLWPTLKVKARLELAKKLVKVIALHHDADIIHTDLHLKNFLVTDDFVYTLDGDGIRQYVGLTYKRALHNLAEMISKFDVLEQAEWLPQMLEAYHTIIRWHLPMGVEQVAPLANDYRLKAVNNYASKVFRNCTDVSVSQSASAFQAWSNSFDLPCDIDFDGLIANGKLLKNGNTCTVALSEVAGRQVVIKRYNIKSFGHALSRALRSSRAAVSWGNAHRLKLLGIPTASPIALMETRRFGLLRGKAYFLTEYIEALDARGSKVAPDALAFFAQTQDKKARAEAVKNICTLFYRLYLLQISHGDTKATNIKMQGTTPLLLDLDAMRQHSRPCLEAHVRDLRRFMQNWKNQPALYNAFVKTFRAVYADARPLELAGVFENVAR
jgi:tRNA A-37 threonylcarbamoyl transferase component Bud32